jgi:lysozyme family protein
MTRSDEYMPRILKHEGGFVDHPRDPGGATNKGVTIGTLRRLGMDLDGDGDVDVSDLKRVSDKDAAKVFKKFYGDAVQADLLPRGLDYAMTDFAVNSGPTRAAEHLQRILGVPVDGHIGPMTLAAMKGRNVPDMINDLCDSRLQFLRALSTWGAFGRGWQSRVEEVRRLAGQDAVTVPIARPSPAQPAQGFWAALFQALFGKSKGR